MQRSKKNSPNKRAKRLLGNIRIWSWESDQEGGIRSLYAQAKHPLGWSPLGKRDITTISNNPNNWLLTLRVIKWYPDSKVDIDSATIALHNSKLAHSENEAKALRKLLLEKSKREHILDIGWVASSFITQPRDIDPHTLIALGSITEPRQYLWNYATYLDTKDTP